MAVRYLSDADLARITGQILRDHGAHGRIPVDIEHIIDVRCAVDIIPREGLLDKFLIDAYISRDLKEIVVDRRVSEQKPPNRFRFTLAHEFAHLVLHDDIYRGMTFATTQEWKVEIASMPLNDYRRMELQANAFASYLLMPPELLRAEVESIRQKIQATGLDPDKLDVQGGDRVLRMLSQTFEVSTKAITVRLEKDGLWNL